MVIPLSLLYSPLPISSSWSVSWLSRSSPLRGDKDDGNGNDGNGDDDKGDMYFPTTPGTGDQVQ